MWSEVVLDLVLVATQYLLLYLSVVDVADSTDIDVRLAALKGSGVVSARIDELCLAPCAES